MAKKVRKAAKKSVRKVATKAHGAGTANIGGVKIRIARTTAKTAKARRIREAVQKFYA